MSYFNEVSIQNPSTYYTESVEVTPHNELKVAEKTKEVGKPFYGSFDNNWWSSGQTGASTVVQTGGQIVLSSIGAGNTCNLQSVRTSRYISGEANTFRAILRSNNLPQAGNTTRWGCFNTTSGIYFGYSGATAMVGYRNNSINFEVSTFNGKGPFVLDNFYHTYEIYMSNENYYMIQDSVLIHTFVASSSPLSDTLHLPIRIENNNVGFTGTTQIGCISASISTQGKTNTTPIKKYIQGAGTYILSRSPGVLHIININNPGGSISIYDDVSAVVGNLIAIMDGTSRGSFDYFAPFFNGLTIVTSGSADVTIVYE